MCVKYMQEGRNIEMDKLKFQGTKGEQEEETLSRQCQ